MTTQTPAPVEPVPAVQRPTLLGGGTSDSCCGGPDCSTCPYGPKVTS